MRVFAAAVVVAIVLAIGAGLGLNLVRMTSAQAYQTGSAVSINRKASISTVGKADGVHLSDFGPAGSDA